MGGIFGIVSARPAALAQPWVQPCVDALRHRGRHAPTAWTGAGAWLASTSLYQRSDEEAQPQPIVTPGGAVVVFDGRLDNRERLLQSCAAPSRVSDAMLCGLAYELWRDAMPAALLGDFALAVFDPRRGEVLLARDALGVRSLSYHQGPDFFIFASEAKAILAYRQVPRTIDDIGVADYFVRRAHPLADLERTCFAGIKSLPPAHQLTFAGGQCATRRYWDFSLAAPSPLRTVADYEEAMREHFATAVRRRLRGSHVAVSVSGGLDSSAIYCQAEALGAHPLGVSYQGPLGSQTDERSFIAAIEAAYACRLERLDLRYDDGAVARMDDEVWHVEAPFVDYLWEMLQKVYALARSKGATLMLSGHWGDQVLYTPAYLVDLWRSGRWLTLRRHLARLPEYYAADEVKALRRMFFLNAAKSLVPKSWQPWAKRLWQRRPGAWPRDPLLGARLHRAAAKASLLPAASIPNSDNARAVALYYELRSRHQARCLEWTDKLAASMGMEHAFPMLDRDFLQFIMHTPGEIMAIDGVPRGLFRRAMRGILPPEIAARHWKADFSGAVNAGLMGDLTRIDESMRQGSLAAALGFLDAEHFGKAVQRFLARGVDARECHHAWDVLDAFGMETWLRMFSEEGSKLNGQANSV